ncbi:hypothetical protein [Nocardioides maradonensis]
MAWLSVSGCGSAIDRSLRHHEIAMARAVALSFFVGLAAGCAWQWLNRRDLVDRFGAVAWMAIAVGIMMLLPGDAVGLDGRGIATVLGLVAGNVLLEWWLRLPASRDRFEESLPRPMTGGRRVP